MPRNTNTTRRRDNVLKNYLLTCQRYRHGEIDLEQLQADTWLTSISLCTDPRLSAYLSLADIRFGELKGKDPIAAHALALVLVETAEKLTLKRLFFR